MGTLAETKVTTEWSEYINKSKIKSLGLVTFVFVFLQHNVNYKISLL